MALTDDQRAMLQLVLERRQSYDDIGSLLGLGTDDVRARARAALAEIGGADPDAEVGLTDYLLGQADPIGRADAARHLQTDPEARELAADLVAKLRVIAPAADLPQLPEARPARRPAREPKPRTEPARSSLSQAQRRMITGLVGGGLLVVVIVLIVTGAFGGGDDDDASVAATATTTGETTGGTTGATGEDSQPPSNPGGRTFAILEPQNGTDAQGAAEFGRIRDRAYLQVSLTGLEPSPANQNYVIWFYGSDDSAFPLSFEKVGENGQLRGLAPIPIPVLSALQEGMFDSIDISLTAIPELNAALKAAKDSRDPPPYVGESILRGEIRGPGAEPPPANTGTTGQSGATGTTGNGDPQP